MSAASPEYDLTSPAFFASPEPVLRAMRERDPVYFHPRLDSWVLTRYDDVQFAIKDKLFSVDRGGDIGKGGSPRTKAKLDWCNRFLLKLMVFSDPPNHTRLRSLVTKAFSPQVIEQLRGSIDSFVGELLAPVLATGRMEVVRDLGIPLPALVTGQMLGLPRERTDDLKRWSTDIFRLLGAGIAPDETIEITYASLTECTKYFESVIESRRADPGHDLLSQLILARDQDTKLSEEELIGMCVTLMAGAYETTTHLIANGLYALLKNPSQLELLRQNPELIESAVEELFRYTGPALSIIRRATTDVELGGRRILAGQNIFCMLHAANHDPAHFSAPERLDIRRQNNRHLGLGHGIHFCVGAALTRLETRTALQAIVQRLPNLALSGKEPVWMPNLVIRGLESLDVVFTAQPPRQRQSHLVGTLHS